MLQIIRIIYFIRHNRPDFDYLCMLNIHLFHNIILFIAKKK